MSASSVAIVTMMGCCSDSGLTRVAIDLVSGAPICRSLIPGWRSATGLVGACPDRGLRYKGTVTVLTARHQSSVAIHPHDWSRMTTITLPDASEEGQREVVFGSDTHRDQHAAALLTSLGGFVASAAFPTTAAGYQDLLAWARSFGAVRRAGVECTGSYGAGLS